MAIVPEQVIHIPEETLDGLIVLHAAGLMHRDVKPSNLLLGAFAPPAPVERLAPRARVAVPMSVLLEVEGAGGRV